MPLRATPPTASIAEPDENGKLFAPSAARNARLIAEFVRDHAPKQGRALEIASGTGQHIIHLADACPGLIWVPTDIDESRIASIRAYVGEAQRSNLALPVMLDACVPGWSATTGAVDLVSLVNLTHLVSAGEVQTLFAETAHALRAGGIFALYGPFKREGALISEGDVRFDASLRDTDPEIGYKNDTDIETWANAVGLTVIEKREMPANNLAYAFQKETS